MDTLTNIRSRLAAGVGLALTATAIFAGAGQAGSPQAGDRAWSEALTVRSQALNQMHELGDSAPSAADSAAEPPWMRALRIRSEGLNRLYGSG